MGYNIENYRRVRTMLEERRLSAMATADARLAEVHRLSPEVAEIDRALASTGMQLFGEATRGGPDLAARIARVRADHESLRAARADLLTSLGFSADYTDPAYTCKACRDTGFVDAAMCECMRVALVTEGVRSSGLGALIGRQSFENFSLKYYDHDPADRERAAYALARAKEYAESFGPDSGNLLLMGPTGLGKTHLSTAIARTVIERGYDVVYETMQNVLADFEYDRFKSGYGETAQRGERYLACELLILDDLGTEQTNAFVVSTLYHLLNTRLNHGRRTVINTNVSGEELRTRYSDRITSRLLGEYEILLFSGNDIRMQKL
ncbi:MAG: ATP-binding protein [Clostridia bacterium]|nr:ATP-binding protein [Clostridia bacterium]